MIIIGHRGARGLAPENTIASVKKAPEHHADMIEFDLRVTKDGVVILHHDADLTDPDGQHHKIEVSSYKELKEHKPDLTTFEELIDSVTPATGLYIEVKGGVPIRPIIKILQTKLKGWRGELWLGSKSQKSLLELHAALPDITKVIIEPWSGVRARRRAKTVGTNIISMNQLWLWRGFITPIAKREWKLVAYTLNDPKKAKRWAKYGLYGVVTDYPDLFDKMK